MNYENEIETGQEGHKRRSGVAQGPDAVVGPLHELAVDVEGAPPRTALTTKDANEPSSTRNLLKSLRVSDHS